MLGRTTPKDIFNPPTSHTHHKKYIWINGTADCMSYLIANCISGSECHQTKVIPRAFEPSSVIWNTKDVSFGDLRIYKTLLIIKA